MTLFESKAPAIMAQLIADFALNVDDAAAILGNIGHECAGFAHMQEIKPSVAGSRGGYGWCQWTGPRRVAFEAWCARKHLEPASDEANYSFLFRELVASEKKAVPALKAAKGLRAKVEAFEKTFLRAGVKHYPSREQWAEWARDAYAAHAPAAPAPVQPAEQGVSHMEEVKSFIQSRTVWASILGLASIFAPSIARHLNGVDAAQLAEAGSQIVTAGSLVAAIFFRVTAKAKIA